MNICDEARTLARHIQETEEYREYIRLKEIAYEDATNKALLDEYKRLQFHLQFTTVGGGQPADEDVQRFGSIASLLQLNEDVCNYMLAEIRFQKMVADVYKILGEACGIDVDALSQS